MKDADRCSDYVAKPELVFVEMKNRKQGEIEEIRTVSRKFKEHEDIAILCLKLPVDFSSTVNSNYLSKLTYEGS